MWWCDGALRRITPVLSAWGVAAGGLVFQPLSQPLLEHFYGRHVASKAPPSLLAEVSEFRQSGDESVVVLSQV